VPRPWLRDEETTAAHLDRLLADAKLINHLQWSKFQGPEYDRFAEELARYGMAVLTSWMYKHTIFERVRARGFGALPPLPASGWDSDDRDGLAHLTVAVALRKFREQVLLRHKWDHTKGATLKTFFIGQCLIRFANHYREWHSEVSKHERHRGPDELDPDTVIDRSNVEHHVVRRDELDRALAALPARSQHALVLYAEGHPQDEIAARLGISLKAFESILSRHRQRLAQQKERDDRAS
jgi:RNA polymerase sigma factor (sigma-70 family)